MYFTFVQSIEIKVTVAACRCEKRKMEITLPKSKLSLARSKFSRLIKRFAVVSRGLNKIGILFVHALWKKIVFEQKRKKKSRREKRKKSTAFLVVTLFSLFHFRTRSTIFLFIQSCGSLPRTIPKELPGSKFRALLF